MIKDLNGREPIGAGVVIGVKSEQGYPIKTDRWHIVVPREENGVRPMHPLFAQFNEAKPEHRKILRGVFVHINMDSCFQYHLKAQILGKGYSHPNKIPACTGDGEKAVRWMRQTPEDFQDIPCTHNLCEYRNTKPPLCKPFARLLFRIRWKDGSTLPTPLVKFTTGSWNTVSNLKGFFDYILGTAKNLGINEPKLFGLPFTLTLAYQTKASVKSRFPVVSITPEIDPIEFFMAQGQQLKQIKSLQNTETLTDSTPAIEYEDQKTISL